MDISGFVVLPRVSWQIIGHSNLIPSNAFGQDRTFAQMTIEQWKLPLQPKVFGTLNLDKYFASSDLAFFLTLSSVVAVVGKAGQSN